MNPFILLTNLIFALIWGAIKVVLFFVVCGGIAYGIYWLFTTFLPYSIIGIAVIFILLKMSYEHFDRWLQSFSWYNSNRHSS